MTLQVGTVEPLASYTDVWCLTLAQLLLLSSVFSKRCKMIMFLHHSLSYVDNTHSPLTTCSLLTLHAFVLPSSIELSCFWKWRHNVLKSDFSISGREFRVYCHDWSVRTFCSNSICCSWRLMLPAHYLIREHFLYHCCLCFVYAWGTGPYGFSSYWSLLWFMARWPARLFFWWFLMLGFTVYFLVVFWLSCLSSLLFEEKAAGRGECVCTKSLTASKRYIVGESAHCCLVSVSQQSLRGWGTL